MKVKYSEYLDNYEDAFTSLVKSLSPHFDHVNLLAKDTKGKSFMASKTASEVSDFQLNERGYVVRVYKRGRVMEYASNQIDTSEDLAQHLLTTFDEMSVLCSEEEWASLQAKWEREEGEFLRTSETGIPLSKLNCEQVLRKMQECSQSVIAKDERCIECRLYMSIAEVSALFVSDTCQYRQAYGFGEGSIVVMVVENDEMKYNYASVSGLQGAELLDKLCSKADSTLEVAIELFKAEKIIPGEYEVITSPEVTGLIAHEAFGHGVEMDMFVKNRALAKDYIGQQIASDIVNMCDGAAGVSEVSSYFFDDEGTLASKTQIIKDGILERGICDNLSACRLGVKATGNGKRQSFDHKAYTRMTNTYFCAGEDSYADMVASIKHGYLLEGMESGMEDPKHWGIQCIVSRGREIKDGKFTGKIVAPVILSGYVPDLLKSISMVSKDFELYGGGYCGKGYKEYVKTSDGGPYLKAKARLG